MVFRLSTVLRLREKERDQAAGAVAEARRAIEKLDSQASEVRSEQSELDQLRLQSSLGTVLPSQLLNIQRYQVVLTGQLQQIALHRDKIMDELARREAVLVKTQQAVKSLERLRESQMQAYEIRQQQHLQDRLDEYSNTQAVLNRQAAISDNAIELRVDARNQP